MLEEKGTLPFGIEKDGAVHREYTLRPQRVCDSVEVFDSTDAERAGKNDSFYAVCIMAQRVSIGGIPQEEITSELLMNMEQIDYNELAAAGKRLDEKRRTFRGAAEAAAAAPGSTVKAGAQLPGDKGNT